MSANLAQVIGPLEHGSDIRRQAKAEAEAELIRRALVARSAIKAGSFAIAAVGRCDAMVVYGMTRGRLTREELDIFLTKLAYRADEGPWSFFYLRPLGRSDGPRERELLDTVGRIAGFATDHGHPLVGETMSVNTSAPR